jgi:hypothetical protein
VLELLLLSAAALVAWVGHSRQSWLVLLLLLAKTHFFGLLLR